MAESPMKHPLSKSSPPQAAAVAVPETIDGKPLTMRGRKRHKCTVCGNIARSRCPFFSCKGCCVKAGNACHIHVLKPSPVGESAQASPMTVPSQGPATSGIVKLPYDSLRLRTVRPSGLITKKEAAIMNNWRFRKLRAYLQDLTAHEDEAFDRYMQNNLLLDELFEIRDAGSPDRQGPLMMAGCATQQISDKEIDVPSVLACLRVRQRLSSKKREAHKQRLKRAIDRSLQKVLYKGEESDDFTENEDIYLSSFPARREIKRMKIQTVEGKDRLRRMEVFTSLVEKVKVVDNQEDFDLCLKTHEENFANNRNTYAAARQESITQPAAFKEQTHTEANNSEKTDNSSSATRKLSASFNARIDSFGVMKEIWKVEADESLLDSSISCIESL